MSYWSKVDPEQEYFRVNELRPWMKKIEEKIDELLKEIKKKEVK